ncbi:MAG: 50S ribosomal protein L22 [Syntrophobacteraceae bacterium]|jgi:large subunit ribosomal protein L22|nr:50S ribosomal protein L22 [Syntrophobacteraceae bacterium]
MDVRAVSKFVRISPTKVRPLADVLRGRKAADALTILKFTPLKGSRLVGKTLKSALANAEVARTIDLDNLVVKTILIDEGPRLKRFRPRAMGRATRIVKRTSHITIVLSEV